MLFHVALLAFALLVNGREITHNKADALNTEVSDAGEITHNNADALSTEVSKANQVQAPAPGNKTAPDMISSIWTGAATAPVATKGVEKDITLHSGGNIVGGKAVFIPVAFGCLQSTPNVDISEGGIGRFRINGEVGNYKLCFQAPGKIDSVEQVAEGSPLTLDLVAPTTTETNVISGLYPQKITVNVNTMIYLEGAGPGDKATWVNAATNDCSAVAPDKDVGVDHNNFIIQSTGTYQLCYRVYGATDSVAQANISLIVRSPGVSQDMTERWKLNIKKDGNIDCATLNYIPFCTMSNRSSCPTSYMIDSAVGYSCAWDDSVFPPFCTVDTNTNNASRICQGLSCGELEDGTPRCWA